MKKAIILCSSFILILLITLSVLMVNHNLETKFYEDERKDELYDILLASFDHSNPNCEWKTVGYLPTIDYLEFLHEKGLMDDIWYMNEMNSLGRWEETDGLNVSEIESPVQQCVSK